MDPIVLAGHQKEAKELAQHLYLSSFNVDLFDVKRLVTHCQAASLDPLSLFDERYHDTLLSLIEAVEKVEQQDADKKATSKVAQ